MTAAARFTIRTVALVGLAGIGFLGGSVVRTQWFDAPTSPAPAAALALDTIADLTAGPPDAPVTVRIFGDYRCPACRALQHLLGDTLLALANAGDIRVVYLHRPLVDDPGAVTAAAAIACTRDPLRRWSMHGRFYDPARAPGESEPPSLAERAAALLRDDAVTSACATADSTRTRVKAAITAARDAGFHEVPTVLVNDRHVRFRTFPALLRHILRATDSHPPP